jgi:hypothetical protein
MQRMTARVLATLLFTEQPAMTAGDLGERLQASSGAISGAVKMLTSVGLVERCRRRPAAATTIACGQRMGDPVHQPEQGDVSGAESRRSRITATEDGSLGRQRLTRCATLQLLVRGDSGPARPLVSAIGVDRDVAHHRSVLSDTLNRHDRRTRSIVDAPAEQVWARVVT